MSSTAAPVAESAPARELNANDMRAVADTLPDDFMDLGEDSPSSDHERHEREDEDLSPEARAAAEGLDLEQGEGEPDRRREPRREGEPEGEEDGERREPEEGDEEREQQAREGEDKGPKPDRIDLRDDAVLVIDGHEVNGAEVKRGFMRQADYTRKTMEVGEQRRQVEELRQRVGSQEAELAQVLDLATEITRGVLPKAPDIRQYDTNSQAGLASYLQDQQFYQSQVKGLETLIQARQTATGQQTAQQRAAIEEQEQQRQQSERARLQEEVRLLQERVPQLRTRDGWNALAADVEKYGGHYSLTPDDVNALRDHRHYAVLMDALAYRKLQAAKPAVEKKAQAAPPIRPAARQASGTRAGDPNRAALDRFRREPSVRTAAATITDAEMGF